MNDLPKPLRAALLVTRELEGLGVPYRVGGSFASSVFGEPRAAAGIDIAAELRPEDARRLPERLGDAFYVPLDAALEAVREHGSFSLLHLESVLKVDVFAVGDDPFQRQSIARSTRLQLGTSPADAFAIPTPEDLVLQKLHWYRLEGETSSKEWLDVLGILKVQGERLDRAHMALWAARIGVPDLLARALEASALSH